MERLFPDREIRLLESGGGVAGQVQIGAYVCSPGIEQQRPFVGENGGTEFAESIMGVAQIEKNVGIRPGLFDLRFIQLDRFREVFRRERFGSFLGESGSGEES